MCKTETPRSNNVCKTETPRTKQESNFVKHARRELTEAGLFDEDSDYGGLIGKAVMRMIKGFDDEGHSGASAARVANIFNILADYGILTPLTEKNANWATGASSHSSRQSGKCGSVFKNAKGIYYVDAITWCNVDSNNSFHGIVAGISSSQFIKSLPFSPKRFRIDVREENNDYVILDKSQLADVAEYYDMNKKINKE